MTLAALIRGARVADSDKSATATLATPATLERVKGRTVATVATVAVANPQKLAADALPDPAAEVRRQRVLAMFAERPDIQRAVHCDGIPVNGIVTIAVGVRFAGGIATAEIEVRADRYDGIALLDLVERHSGTLH